MKVKANQYCRTYDLDRATIVLVPENVPFEELKRIGNCRFQPGIHVRLVSSGHGREERFDYIEFELSELLGFQAVIDRVRKMAND